MKNIWKAFREMLRQCTGEMRATWKLSREVEGLSKKIRTYVWIYMNMVFLLGYVACCYISILFILVGLIGGVILAIKESPVWLLLFLLPIAALPPMAFVHKMRENHWTALKEEYFKKHDLPLEQ